MGFGNPASIEFARDWLEGVWEVVYKDFAVDLGSMHGSASCKQQLTLLRNSFEQQLEFLADQRFLSLFADAALNLHQVFAAPLNLARRELRVQCERLGAFFVGISKCSHPIKLSLADEFAKLLEFIFGFAGKADNEGGS